MADLGMSFCGMALLSLVPMTSVIALLRGILEWFAFFCTIFSIPSVRWSPKKLAGFFIDIDWGLQGGGHILRLG